MKLVGNWNDLEALRRDAEFAKTYNIDETPEGFVLSMESTQENDDPCQWVSKLRELVTCLNGYLWSKTNKSGSVVGVGVRSTDERKTTIYIEQPATAYCEVISPRRSLVAGTIGETKPTSHAHQHVIDSIFDGDDQAKAIYSYLGSEKLSWPELYNVFEALKKSQKRIKNWPSKSQTSRFTRSANSDKVSGYAARHYGSTDLPPQDPMDIEEAYSFIKTLVQEWQNARN